MKKKEKEERVFVNPFSNVFIPIWELWKQYKKEEHRFSYKSAITEQAAINNLSDLSKGDELMARQIIMQSISQGWKGFFDLKISINGKQITSNSNAARQCVNDELNKRFK